MTECSESEIRITFERWIELYEKYLHKTMSYSAQYVGMFDGFSIREASII
jgi:hypothetical protein